MNIGMAGTLAVYLLTATLFLCVDFLYLRWFARDFLQQQLGPLLRPQVNLAAALGVYLLFAAGLVFFAIRPAIAEESAARALLYGALFGFFTYATYDLTNLATLKGWPTAVALVDIAWGTALSAAVSWITFLLTSRWILGR